MHGLVRIVPVTAVGLLLAFTMAMSRPLAAEDGNSVVILFKDGHRQSLATAGIERIDLKAPATVVYKDGHHEKLVGEIERIEFADSPLATMKPGRSHFIGKWEVGDGNGNRFFITLEDNGVAKKSLGSPHGTWTVVDGEARISWEDGWHDAIRRIDGKHEKVAFEPGKGFDDTPSNIAPARNTESKPI